MKKEKIKNIWHKYQKVLLLSFFFFLFCYGIKLFTYSYSLDTEAFMIYRESFLNSWLQLNRFSLVALKEIFAFIPFNIYVTNWITVFLFYLASVFTYFNFARVCSKIREPKKAFFFLAVIGSSPIFLEQFNFTLQSAEIAFFLLLFQIGIYFLQKYFEEHKKYYACLTILLLFICLGAYQSFAPLYIAEGIILLFINVTSEKIKSNKEIFNYIFHTILIFLLSFFLYFLVAKLLLNILNLNSNSYLSNQISWLHNPLKTSIFQIIKSIACIYFGGGYFVSRYVHFTFLNLFVLILGLKESLKYFKKKKYFLAILMLMILASPLIMTFLLGNHEPVRAQFTLPIVISLLLTYTWIDKKSFTILVTCFVIGQVLVMGALQYNDYIRFQNDKNMAAEIYEDVKEYLPNRKLIIVGAKDSDIEGKIKVRGEAMGISFFDHYGLSDRATTFMKTLGYPIEDAREYIHEATNLVKDLEAYPKENSILVNDQYVIVKLS